MKRYIFINCVKNIFNKIFLYIKKKKKKKKKQKKKKKKKKDKTIYDNLI